MSKAKHAGWESKRISDDLFFVRDGDGNTVATVWDTKPNLDGAANARLIAEAPVLKDYLSSARVVLARMRRSMMAHPDHEVDSEFDGLTTESQILEDEIIELIKKKIEK